MDVRKKNFATVEETTVQNLKRGLFVNAQNIYTYIYIYEQNCHIYSERYPQSYQLVCKKDLKKKYTKLQFHSNHPIYVLSCGPRGGVHVFCKPNSVL